MKSVSIAFLALIIFSSAASQNRNGKNSEDTKIDTIFVFQYFDSRFAKELNTFWKVQNEIGVNQVLGSAEMHSKRFELSLIFFNADSVKVNMSYDLDNPGNLKAECKIREMYSQRDCNNPIGTILLKNKTPNKLTLYFDIGFFADDKKTFLVYKGERDFKRDY
jgi:hypothetical protein